MRLISKSTIQEVNSRIDAIAIIGDYVRLEKKSGRWWGRCPFHAGGQEKTPSFKVDPDIKMFHCFGCGKGGSVISFVMEMDSLSYPEAIKNLAGKSGIAIVYEEGSDTDIEDNSVKEELFELYRRTTTTFQHFLHEKSDGNIALKYLEDRKISPQIIDSFKLGFAPADREFLHRFLRQKGYSDDFLEKSGLFSSRYKTISLFSGRLIFPITDRQGRIVAFGGRLLPGARENDGEAPKYINSPETEIYKKGQTLFAIDTAKPEMRKTKTAFLAEGYMDVIALHEAGILNAVAPLGTAFTDEQASWLRRWVEKAVLFFDNDEAGHKAAYKNIIICRKNGLLCEMIDFNKALMHETGEENGQLKDPADILQKFGPQILKKVSNCTINDFEYLIYLGTSQIGSERGGTRVAEFLFPFLNALDSEVERGDCISRIAEAIRVERNAVLKDYANWKEGGALNSAARRTAEEKLLPKEKVRRNAELVLLAFIAFNMELYSEFRAALEIKEIDDPAAKELFVSMEECFLHEESGIDSLLARIRSEALKDFIVSHGDSPEFKAGGAKDPRLIMEDGIKKVINLKRLKKRQTEIGAEICTIERNRTENSDIEELLSEKIKLDSQIRELEGR
ncbi:MAG: DNA primase [Treponema sp.]|jgi:DNA primase|nr:DNA primase [Treponema sp.]